MNILVIGIGGALGAISRYVLSEIISKHFESSYYIGTFIVNVLGCLLVGFIFSYFADLRSELQLFFVIGFLGSFTTMSAFSMQAVEMFNNQSFGEASVYIFMTILFTILATYIGLTLGSLK
jgi:CrcB protein